MMEGDWSLQFPKSCFFTLEIPDNVTHEKFECHFTFLCVKIWGGRTEALIALSTP